jgi:hypothetical protein
MGSSGKEQKGSRKLHGEDDGSLSETDCDGYGVRHPRRIAERIGSVEFKDIHNE